MHSWRTVRLGEVVDCFDAQRVPLSGLARSRRSGPYSYYGASGVIDSVDDYIFDGRYLLIAEDGENLNSRKLPIAFAAEGKFWVNNHAHVLRGKPGLADDTFLKLWFAFADVSPYITGTAQPKLSQANLKRVTLSLPPLSTQRRIASILSAYDDLIENNTRRIQILEEMAQAIYREWFVEFRFPGHEDVRMVDSELGLIPEDWDIRNLSEVVSTQYGYTESATTTPMGPKFLRGMDMNKASFIDWSQVPYCPIPESEVPKFQLEIGDILVIRMADPGKVSIVERRVDAVFASYLVRFRTLDDVVLMPYFLFYTLLADRYQSYARGATTGTTRGSLSAKAMTAFSFALPPNALQQIFIAIVEPIRALLGNLVTQNANLRTTRDLLLPRLISGEIDVSNLDIGDAESAA